MRRSERSGVPPGRGSAARQAGYVTAESAVVIPVLVGLTGLLVWGLTAAVAQVRCVDAARAGAREAARSETPAAVTAAARAAAPAGARVRVWHDGDLVRVRVTVPAPRFPLTLTAEAAALDEATVGSAAGAAAGPP